MPKLQRSKQILLGCGGVLALLILAVFASAVFMTSGGVALSKATPADLAAARAKWKKISPPDYDLTVKVGGRRAATYRVEVRGGIARNAWHNDRPISQQRLFSVWSVPGMFDTIEREFELMQSGPTSAEGRPAEVSIHCFWHPTFGFPQSYQRLAAGGDEIYWEVTRFVTYPDGIKE